jgi:hypothetical protein
MSEDLGGLREVLLHGIRLSMQGSYARRRPAKRAIPILEDGRRRLRRFVQDDPSNAEAWRLLSQAEECLLNYPEGIRCLEHAITLSKTRSKKDLKRLALLKAAATEWRNLPLNPRELQELGDFLVRSGVEDEARGRTFRFTRQWLHDRNFENTEAVLAALRSHGGHTDFQILANIVRG